MLCSVCHQPECADSTPGEKRPDALPTSPRLERGWQQHRGYEEFAVHPDEAAFVLHRGWVVLDGERRGVVWVHNEAHVTHLQVSPRPESGYVQTATGVTLREVA